MKNLYQYVILTAVTFFPSIVRADWVDTVEEHPLHISYTFKNDAFSGPSVIYNFTKNVAISGDLSFDLTNNAGANNATANFLVGPGFVAMFPTSENFHLEMAVRVAYLLIQSQGVTVNGFGLGATPIRGVISWDQWDAAFGANVQWIKGSNSVNTFVADLFSGEVRVGYRF